MYASILEMEAPDSSAPLYLSRAFRGIKYLPSSRKSGTVCTATHSSFDERVHAGVAAFVQFMKTGVAL